MVEKCCAGIGGRPPFGAATVPQRCVGVVGDELEVRVKNALLNSAPGMKLITPVMAASLTEATPSMISPSDGITSPASTSTTSPTEQLVRRGGDHGPGRLVDDRLGLGGRRGWRAGLSAAALPRPSAMLSAKLANSTVAHSQAAICRAKPAAPARCGGHGRWRWCARTATTSVAKITGLPSKAQRVELGEGVAQRPGPGWPRTKLPTRAADLARGRRRVDALDGHVMRSWGFSRAAAASTWKCSTIGPRARAGEELQAAHDQDHPDQAGR